MAPADSTSSPRDHAADANPELARKKLRLSEDPGASPSESIIIEVDEPDDIGSTMDTAIEIEDGVSLDIDNYSDDFFIYSETITPLRQVRWLLEQIRKNYYMELPYFTGVARALEVHVHRRLDESGEWHQHYLEDEVEFFNVLLLLVHTMLNTGDLLELKDKSDVSEIRQGVSRLLIGLEALCRRIIPALPDAIKAVLSRRDSAHASTRQHTIDALYYLLLASQAISMEAAPTLASIASYDRHLDLDQLRKSNVYNFATEPIVSSLAAIIKTLGGAMRDIKDSWIFLEKALSLFKIAVDTYSLAVQYPNGEVESVIEVINACILPTIREKHPRALPEGFHEMLLKWGDHALMQHIYHLDQAAAATAFRLFVGGSFDALVPEAVDESSMETALYRVCDGNQKLLAKLIADSWVMQTAKMFICSDIMDIRMIGFVALEHRLVAIYRAHEGSSEGFEHSEVQHAVRFLRKNEMIPYILGPESRAGLLHKSLDLVTFLAATHNYTDAETDIIWRACSTSVEADFVKASFAVFQQIKPYLDFERLVYIARKYSSTTVSSFGVDALDFLPQLLQQIQHQSSQLAAASDKLAIAFVSIDILKAANCSRPCPTRDRLKEITLIEIARFALHPFSADDRLQIYEFCIPEILSHTARATTSVEVLDVLLQQSLHLVGAEHILNLLPVNSAVDELCLFVRERKQNHASRSEIPSIIARLNCLGHLVFLSPVEPDISLQGRLFSCLFGEEAFSNEARNAAWQKLNDIAFGANSSPKLRSLFQAYMKDYVASLPANLATPGLVDILLVYLRSISLRQADLAEMTPLLSLPIWKTIVRFAITSPNDAVADRAAGAILDMLFVYPFNTGSSLANEAIQIQCEFVREHVKCLRSLNDACVAQRSQANVRSYIFAMRLLDRIFHSSQEQLSANKLPPEPGVLTMDETVDNPDRMMFTAQVYGMSNEPNIIRVLASPTTKVSELLAKIPAFTSTVENRVIVGGIEVTNMPDKSLADAGVLQSGVIHIRPKYSFGIDFDKLLTHLGPVEQAILSQHGTLEAFLDGPPQTAFPARLFLEKVRLPAEYRFRVVSSETTADVLFPRDRNQRTMFSLFVLKTHLSDFCRLGVVDLGFILRATHLLTGFILDRDRAFDPYIMIEVLNTLCLVLRERPQGDEDLEYFDKSSDLCSRLIELLFHVKLLPLRVHLTSTGLPLRNELAATIYKTLILAYQNSKAVWAALTENEAATELHAQLMLDKDIDFSLRVAQALETVLDDEAVPRERLNFYWQVLYHCLSEALSSSYQSEYYFILLNKIMDGLGSMHCEELWISTLVEELCSKLWSYQHLEFPPLLIIDRAMPGLLLLLSKAVATLRKKQKSSRILDGLPSKLFRRFLFPSSNDAHVRPIISEDTRSIVYDLMKMTFHVQNDYDELIQLAGEAVTHSLRVPGFFYPGMPGWIRPASNAAGLNNLGMTCYMNSLLQQLFGNLQFRKFILDLDIVDENKQAALSGVQDLFASMQDGVNPFADPKGLAGVLNVQVGVQEDVHTFYTNLLSRLEDSMPDPRSRQKLISFFTGKSVTQIRGDCGHVSSKEEPFTELSITVKNKASLHESLSEFVQGEPLEGSNKYMCMSCDSEKEGRLVNALRRTCLEDIPNSLTFCLKRFAFEYDGENKVNDRFEFPAEIDMSIYKRSHLDNPEEKHESDVFELVGVIVHQGSLSFGHYWSYVRAPAPQGLYACPWMYLEDSKYFACTGGVQEVQENCFGGLRWSDGTERPESAYVLFYQRKSYIAEADKINSVERLLQIDQQILPKVPLQSHVATRIGQANHCQLRIALLFHDRFSGFLQWLLDHYPERLRLHQNAIASHEESDQERLCLETTDSNLDAQLGGLIANYLLRIFLPAPDCEERLDQVMKSVSKVVDLRPTAATHICKHFGEDAFACIAVVQHGVASVRSELFSFLLKCLKTMRQEKAESYDRAALDVIKAHSGLLYAFQGPDNFPRAWREYLTFAASFAITGPDETLLVLQHGYLKWIFSMLYMNYEPKYKSLHSNMELHLRNSILDRTALFDFLHDVFNGYMDLSELPPDSGVPERVEGPEGWRLLLSDANALVVRNPKKDRPTGLLIETGIHSCPKRFTNWKDYAPGKLIGLLVGPKTHPDISKRMCELLRVQCDLEEVRLDPLLYIMLHVLSQLPHVDGGMKRCSDLLECLCRNLILWRNHERRSLWFFRQAHDLVPELVVDSFPMWATKFLLVDGLQSRQATSNCLKDIIFAPAPMLDNVIEATRIARTRRFLHECDKQLRSPHTRKDSRAPYECMITAFKYASDYLVALEDEVEKRQEAGEEINHRVMTEYDEIKSLVKDSVRYLEDLQDWEPVTALPTRSIGIRRTVEVEDSDDLDTSEADGEDDYSEASGSWAA